MACSHGVRLSPLGTAATVWPIVPPPDDKWWLWSNRWNANWQGKPKFIIAFVIKVSPQFQLISFCFHPYCTEWQMNTEQFVGMRIGRGNRSTRRKPTPVPLCPPHTPHGLTWNRKRVAAVGSRRLTAWAGQIGMSNNLKYRSANWFPFLIALLEWLPYMRYSSPLPDMKFNIMYV
jgi:hypothetical protein